MFVTVVRDSRREAKSRFPLRNPLETLLATKMVGIILWRVQKSTAVAKGRLRNMLGHVRVPVEWQAMLQ